jgi:hypothetical protein
MLYLDSLDWNTQYLADEMEIRTSGVVILGELFAQKFNFTFAESSSDRLDI